jgi:tetratricopeptide (TPR) repeat protein
MTYAEINKYLKNPGLLNEQTLAQAEGLVRDFPAFDLGWAIWLKTMKNLGVRDLAKYLPEVALRVADRKWLRDFLETPVNLQRDDGNEPEYLSIADYNLEEETGSAKVESDENKTGGRMLLIDSFLANGGRMERMQAFTGTVETFDLSEKAVAENDDIVTETFANILLAQGKNDKAVEAFEKLSLKYPEKSIYFAARIEEIKLLLKIK